VLVALLWRYADLHHMIYEGLPGMLVALILGYILSEKEKR
jgi:hypothetical protein